MAPFRALEGVPGPPGEGPGTGVPEGPECIIPGAGGGSRRGSRGGVPGRGPGERWVRVRVRCPEMEPLGSPYTGRLRLQMSPSIPTEGKKKTEKKGPRVASHEMVP